MTTKKPSRNAQRLLTVREVMAAKNEGDHSDGGGVYLRIRGDSSSWLYRYTSPGGKRREMGLGPALRVDAAVAGESLTNARSEADKARALLATGVDPIDARKGAKARQNEAKVAKKIEAKAEALTLARAARKYHERFIETELTAKHSAQWLSSLENHIPDDLWHRPIASIQADELLDLIRILKVKIPETAGRIRQRLDSVFDDALFRKLVAHNPAAAIRNRLKAKGKKNKRKVVHFRSLPYDQVPGFMKQLETAIGTAPIAFRFLVLTAARTSEVLFASWSEFDIPNRTWTLAADRMKGGEDHVVYLSDAALAIIESRAADPNRDPQWIFPSPIGNKKPMSNMAFLVLLRRMKLDHLTTAHGFRSSFSTWANDSGRHRSEAVEACLAHKESDLVKAAYNRAQFATERKALLQEWAAYCVSPDQIEMKDAA